MALVKEDVRQLLIQLESFGKVEEAALDRPVRTDDEQLRQELPLPLPLPLLTREPVPSCARDEIIDESRKRHDDNHRLVGHECRNGEEQQTLATARAEDDNLWLGRRGRMD